MGALGRPVVCVETGVEYSDKKAAAKACRTTYSSIDRSLVHGTKVGGFTWRWANPEEGDEQPQQPSV
eukprot:g59207.t1